MSSTFTPTARDVHTNDAPVLSEGWRLFLSEIRQLAAESRRRRAARTAPAATNNDNQQADETQHP